VTSSAGGLFTVDDSSSLVSRASRGDQPAVDELLERHLPGLRAYIRLRIGPDLRARESASDVAQSVCREVLENLDRFRYGGESGFRHWLYTTALRRLQNKWEFHTAQKRDVGRETRLPSGATGVGPLLGVYRSLSTPSGAAMGREQLARIESAFDALSDDDREVIVLSRLVGFTHKEIGEHMGRSEGAARVALHRALARLAEALDAGGD
jgi:RNA polymerase sigma-70 factor (ECF subfamily)